MRKLRNDTDNLRDRRISYIFLLSLALLCLIMGIVSENLGVRLHREELADSRRALTLCADALREWENAEAYEERYAAAVRFESAVASLPAEVDVDALLGLAAAMRSQNYADSKAVHALSDTFSLLGAIDYTDDAEARHTIAQALEAASDSVIASDSEAEEEVAALPLPEVTAYASKIAKKGIKAVFGSRAGTLEPVLSDTGDSFYAEAENIRMTFSASDGRMESFVYIRLGDTPEYEMSRSERLLAAEEFFDLNRRIKAAKVTDSGEICGFLIADIEAGKDTYRAAVDRYGRVWSLTKVSAMP